MNKINKLNTIVFMALLASSGISYSTLAHSQELQTAENTTPNIENHEETQKASEETFWSRSTLLGNWGGHVRQW